MMLAPSHGDILRFDGDGRVQWDNQALNVTQEMRYILEDERISRFFKRALSPELADLMDIAMAVYVADRLVRRRPSSVTPYDLCWSRPLHVQIPVRLLDMWKYSGTLELLQKALELFTEDHWEIDFVHRSRAPRISEGHGFLFSELLEKPVEIGLFSGGLDSLAGVASSLEHGAPRSLVLVSGATNPRLRNLQEDLLAEIVRAHGDTVHPLTIPLHLQHDGLNYNHNEISQRSRGFLYGSLGAVIAFMAEASGVTIYENGVGAINLPYNATQIGAHNTRSTNPIALDALSALLRSILGRPIRFHLPNLFSTKGAMCAALARTPLARLAKHTVSCDGFPQRTRGVSQCGRCTSCLLRRQALWSTELGESDLGSLYRYDVLEMIRDIPVEKLHSLRVMLGQVDTLQRLLDLDDPWQGLIIEYPMLNELEYLMSSNNDGSQCGNVSKKLVSLLRRYCEEWRDFPARPPNWSFGFWPPQQTSKDLRYAS